MTNAIICPFCGKQIEISQAINKEIREDILADERKKHEEKIADIQKHLQDKIRKEYEEKTNIELSDLKRELEDKKVKLEHQQQFELKLRIEKRELEEEKKTLALNIERKLDEERKKIEDQTAKYFYETHRLKDMEKDKIIQDLQTALEDARRKSQLSSQQLQGEVQELDLELTLKEFFSDDEIMPVEKGVKGADIRQIVKTTRKNICGVILWESKRTKNWSHEWINKLKEDLRREKANIPIIVSNILPKEVENGMGFIDGVWISNYQLFLPLAEILRQKLIEVARERYVAQNRGEKKDLVYDYITGHEFKQQVESLIEVYQDMYQQILRERTVFEKTWKTREAQVQKMFTSVARVTGSMRGIVGSSFPPIKGMDLLEEGKDDQTSLLNDT